MRSYTLFKRSISLSVVILATVTLALPWPAQTQSTVGQNPSATSVLDVHLHKARESFLKKDYRDAAAEIRLASTFLNNESTKAAGEAKQDLTSSCQELAVLADRVEKKAVRSEKELDDSFARAEYALARQYHAMASESWAKKEASQAGQYLKTAAAHLENALTSAHHRIEEKSKKVIAQARDVGEKMEKGAGVAAADVGKSLDAIKKEIDETARKIPLKDNGGYLHRAGREARGGRRPDHGHRAGGESDDARRGLRRSDPEPGRGEPSSAVRKRSLLSALFRHAQMTPKIQTGNERPGVGDNYRRSGGHPYQLPCRGGRHQDAGNPGGRQPVSRDPGWGRCQNGPRGDPHCGEQNPFLT